MLPSLQIVGACEGVVCLNLHLIGYTTRSLAIAKRRLADGLFVAGETPVWAHAGNSEAPV